jgi:PadR family transcriptional regulator PadR
MSTRIGLGEFELLVLVAVLNLGDEAYGSAVFRVLEETGRRVSLGAVYTTLSRMEEKGLVSSETGEPTAVRGGRAKRYFRLEPGGRSALRESLAALDQLREGTEFALA